MAGFIGVTRPVVVAVGVQKVNNSIGVGQQAVGINRNDRVAGDKGIVGDRDVVQIQIDAN